MSNTKKWISFAIILSGLTARGFPQAGGADSSGGSGTRVVLTIDSTISRAVAERPRIHQAEGEVRAARAAVGEAQSGYYPGIKGSADYTRVEPDQSFTFPGLGTFSLSQQDNWDFHVGVSQLVYDFGRRELEVRLAENQVSSGLIGLEEVKSDLAYRAARAFYSALFLREQLASLDGQLADLNEHLSVVQEKERIGSATKYNVLSTRVQVAALQSQRVQTSSQYLRAKIQLADLVGIDPSADIAVKGDFAPAPGTGDSASLVARALSGRPEMQKAAAAQKAARLGLDLARAGGMPAIIAHAEAGYKNGLLPDGTSLTFNWNAGLTLDVPLFNGFITVKKTEEAQARLEAAAANSAAVKEEIAIEVLQAARDVDAGIQAERISRVRLDQAEQALEAARIQYDLGVVTNDEYLSARTALEQARLANLDARYNEVLSEYALEQAIGRRIWP